MNKHLARAMKTLSPMSHMPENEVTYICVAKRHTSPINLFIPTNIRLGAVTCIDRYFPRDILPAIDS